MAPRSKRKAGKAAKAPTRQGHEGNAVYIATPTIDGRPFSGYVRSIWTAREDLIANGIAHDYTELAGDSLVTRARNVLVGHFLMSTDFSHLMFIDCDLEFNPASIRMLLEDDLDIVAGIYPKKTDNEEYVLNFPPSQQSDIVNGCCVEMRDVGTGFLMVHRRVFERLISTKSVEKIDRPVPSAVSEGLWPGFKENYWNFFGERIIDGEHLSEDYAFCRLCTQVGIKTFADVRINLNHIGTKTYPGRVWPYMQARIDDKTQELFKCQTSVKDTPKTTTTSLPKAAE